MVKVTDILYYSVHIQELRSVIQWTTWHDPVHKRDPQKEAPSLRKCFEFLDQTSRSFSSVIQELHPELLVPIALFYLVLRGLDTIEDDMTLVLKEKDQLLRKFHEVLEKEGWNFDGSGPGEKDRQLLVEFQNVTEEIRKIKAEYREIIKDIANKMGNGMADFCANAEYNENGVNTLADYDLYCHYVAGLVGNGLTRLFVESGFANPALLERLQLQESMGLFLQKTNIIRDVKEDWDEKRRFYPKEIWSKHVNNFEDLFDPKYKMAALNCSSEMVLNALNHADQCLFYLAGMKEQSVFNFAAIPQCMAIATLELVFRNPNIFKRNVKITKGESCRIMMRSTQNLRLVCEVFKEYTRKIHRKNTPQDPNFLQISIACGKIEQFIETLFPSQNAKQLQALRDAEKSNQPPPPGSEEERKAAAAAKEAREDTMLILGAVMGTVILMAGLMFLTAYLFGARFDIAFQEIKKGIFRSPSGEDAKSIVEKYDRGEL